MTGVRASRVNNLALPIRGLNTNLPPHLLPPEYSPWLSNFDSQGYFFKARTGLSKVFTPPANFVSGIVAHPTNINKVLFVDTYNVNKRLSSYDITTSTTSLIGSLAGANSTSQVLAFNYERHSYFFYPNSAPSIFDGTTFSAMSITGPTAANVIGGCVYKNRLYLFESNGGSVWYTETPRNTSGTFIEFPMTGSIQQSGVLNCIFAVTTADTAYPQTFLGGFFNTGEVVIYQGSYPGSQDWSVAGVFNVGTPLSIQSYINVEGDIWLLTYGGITSVRELINGNPQNKLTKNISRYWEEVVKNVAASVPGVFSQNDPSLGRIRGAYHQGERKVLITIPGYLYATPDTGTYTFTYADSYNSFLTYDLDFEAWIPAYSIAITDEFFPGENFITPYYWGSQNIMYLGCNSTALESGWIYWDPDNDLFDESFSSPTGYDLEVQTAFTKTVYISKLNGVFISHEGAEEVKQDSEVKYLVDYNASQTETQGLASDTPETITRDMYNLQAQGISFSVAYKANALAYGFYNLYGLELLLEEGKGIS